MLFPQYPHAIICLHFQELAMADPAPTGRFVTLRLGRKAWAEHRSFQCRRCDNKMITKFGRGANEDRALSRVGLRTAAQNRSLSDISHQSQANEPAIFEAVRRNRTASGNPGRVTVIERITVVPAASQVDGALSFGDGQLCELDVIDVVVTDARTPEPMLEMLRGRDVQVVVTKQS